MTRSAVAFALGARIGVTIVVMPMRVALLREVLAVTAVVVANEIPGLCAPGRRFDDLSPDPLCRRMPRDVDVDDAPAVMRDEDQHVYRAEHEGLHREQIDRPDRGRVVVEEGAPAL